MDSYIVIFYEVFNYVFKMLKIRSCSLTFSAENFLNSLGDFGSS